MSFSRSKKNRNLIFWMQTIFQNLTCQKLFNSKAIALHFFKSKIWRIVEKLIRNLTRRKKFDSKSERTTKLWFKIWRDEKFSIQKHAFFNNLFMQNHAFVNKIYSQNLAYWKNFFLKIVLFEIARKTQILRNLRGNLNQNVIFQIKNWSILIHCRRSVKTFGKVLKWIIVRQCTKIGYSLAR